MLKSVMPLVLPPLQSKPVVQRGVAESCQEHEEGEGGTPPGPAAQQHLPGAGTLVMGLPNKPVAFRIHNGD